MTAISAGAPSIAEVLTERRERVFLVLAGIFICSMTMLNIIGITRFIQLGPMSLALGVLPYPLTFLCTDIICELYGRARANFMVTLGLFLNFFILGIMTLGNYLPAVAPEAMPPWQVLQIKEAIALPSGRTIEGSVELFELIYACTSGAVFASMMAYIAAQYADVRLFHFFKRLTKGKHLWLRNNFSTMLSQMVDSFMVIGITFGAAFLAGMLSFNEMMVLMASNYLFKFCVAVLDTIPFYICVGKLKDYLQIDNGSVR